MTEAQRITVGLGQTTSDINIALSPTRLARVPGTAVDSSGKTMSGGLLIMMQTSGAMFMQSVGGQVKPDGSFSIANVAPGEYSIRALPNSGPTPGPVGEVIQAEISVAGEDINDLRLVGVKPSTASGRVIPPVSQTGTAGLRELQLLFVPKVPVPLGGTSGGRVIEDGTFELKVQPGNAYLRLNPTGAFAGTRIRTLRLNGVDVTVFEARTERVDVCTAGKSTFLTT